MKIWIDIMTPKQLLFSEAIIKRLGRRHTILCTSRDYGEVSGLAGIRRVRMLSVGRYGGKDKAGKLRASVHRMKELAPRITSFAPDLAISYGSTDASRIAFGLGVRHVAFCDAPHSEAAMRLSIPLLYKLFTNWIIPKKEFTRFGIRPSDIIRYRALDAAVTLRRRTDPALPLPFPDNGRKNIVVRVEETEAAYMPEHSRMIPIVSRMAREFGGENLVILGRYADQVRGLRRAVGRRARVVRMSVDGPHILRKTDVFVGSGGTMTAEAALMGVPTISYNPIPNIIEKYLVSKRIAMRGITPASVARLTAQMLARPDAAMKRRAARILSQMEDPIDRLVDLIRTDF